MPDSLYIQPATRSPQVGRWTLTALLLLALLLIGIYDDPALTFLTVMWERLLAAFGLHRLAAAMQQGINGGITKRLLPAVATYAALYLGICLLLLRLVLAPAQWRMAVKLYAGILGIYVGITLVGKLAGDAVWAYRLSRQILDFVVSPLPVAGLYVLFRAGFGPRVARA
ncbi:XrtX-associated membrane protein [Hymenobacter ruber]